MALLASCNKVELDPVDGEPVFVADLKLDGTAKSWQAGVHDYYMFSSFEKDEFEVHVFSGRFAKKDSLVGESLSFHIRDFQQAGSGQPEVEDALSPGRDFSFADASGNDTTWVLNLNTTWFAAYNASESITPNLHMQYEWDFGDGIIDSNSFELVNHNYNSMPQNMPVTLTISASDNSCSSFIRRRVSVGNNAQCDMDLLATFNAAVGNIQLNAQPIGSQPFSFLWSNGATVDSISLDSLSPGQNSASVTVTDNAGCTVEAGISAEWMPGVFPNICVAGFNYNISEQVDSILTPIITYYDSLQFSKITIVYTNETGIEYRSDKQPQAPDAFIEIIKLEDYDLNENGEKTKRITLEFTCRLWNESGEFIDVTDGEAVIAVAYP